MSKFVWILVVVFLIFNSCDPSEMDLEEEDSNSIEIRKSIDAATTIEPITIAPIGEGDEDAGGNDLIANGGWMSIPEESTTQESTSEGKHGGRGNKKRRLLGSLLGSITNLGNSVVRVANTILRPIGIQIPNVSQLLYIVRSVIGLIFPDWYFKGPDFVVVSQATIEYYCQRFGPLHVLCACSGEREGFVYYERGVSPEYINFIVGYFNNIRTGLLQGSLAVSWGSVRAYEICLLNWSQELQLLAQGIADQGHSTLNNSLYYSTDKFLRVSVSIAATQGVYQRNNGNPWNDAFRRWYINQVSRMPRDLIYHPNSDFDDISNILWADSFQVGCGYSSFTTSYSGQRTNIFVCAFAPAGNIPDSKMFADSPGVHVSPLVRSAPKSGRGIGLGLNVNLDLDLDSDVNVNLGVNLHLTVTNPFNVRPVATCWNGIHGLPYHPICVCQIKEDPSIVTPTLPPPPATRPTHKPDAITSTSSPRLIPTTPPPTLAPPVYPPPPPLPPPALIPTEPSTDIDDRVVTLKPSKECIPETYEFNPDTRKFILQQPYIVFISYEPLDCLEGAEALKCTGFIYNSRWLVTSFHCALPTLLRDSGKPTHHSGVLHYGQSILNSTTTKTARANYRTIVGGAVPSQIDIQKQGIFDNINFNIALLQLDSKIIFTKYAKAVKIAPNNNHYEEQRTAMLHGWSVKKGKDVEIIPNKIETQLLSENESKSEFPDFQTEHRFASRHAPTYEGTGSISTHIGGPLVTIVFTDSNQAPVPIAESFVLGVLPVSLDHRAQADKSKKTEYFTRMSKWLEWIQQVAGPQDMDWDM